MKIAIGTDHAGFEVKARLFQFLQSLGHEVIDCGSDDEDSCDYPDYAHKVAELVSKNQVDRGLLICGSGIGMDITANRYSGVRAFVSYNHEMTKVARQHNNVNVICFGARTTSLAVMKESLQVFLTTEFEKGRHERRINKIDRRES
jgi:ribose 5-phosphate isomerase B